MPGFHSYLVHLSFFQVIINNNQVSPRRVASRVYDVLVIIEGFEIVSAAAASPFEIDCACAVRLFHSRPCTKEAWSP